MYVTTCVFHFPSYSWCTVVLEVQSKIYQPVVGGGGDGDGGVGSGAVPLVAAVIMGIITAVVVPIVLLPLRWSSTPLFLFSLLSILPSRAWVALEVSSFKERFSLPSLPSVYGVELVFLYTNIFLKYDDRCP